MAWVDSGRWASWTSHGYPLHDAGGAVPNVRNLSVGGHSWNVYRGSNGANAVFHYCRELTYG